MARPVACISRSIAVFSSMPRKPKASRSRADERAGVTGIEKEHALLRLDVLQQVLEPALREAPGPQCRLVLVAHVLRNEVVGSADDGGMTGEIEDEDVVGLDDLGEHRELLLDPLARGILVRQHAGDPTLAKSGTALRLQRVPQRTRVRRRRTSGRSALSLYSSMPTTRP